MNYEDQGAFYLEFNLFEDDIFPGPINISTTSLISAQVEEQFYFCCYFTGPADDEQDRPGVAWAGDPDRKCGLRAVRKPGV